MLEPIFGRYQFKMARSAVLGTHVSHHANIAQKDVLCNFYVKPLVPMNE